MTSFEPQILHRNQVLDVLGISDRTERRMRLSDKPWPPHLVIGNRVYYRLAAIEEFLLAQELACSGSVATQNTDTDDHATVTGAPALVADIVDEADARTASALAGHTGPADELGSTATCDRSATGRV